MHSCPATYNFISLFLSRNLLGHWSPAHPSLAGHTQDDLNLMSGLMEPWLWRIKGVPKNI